MKSSSLVLLSHIMAACRVRQHKAVLDTTENIAVAAQDNASEEYPEDEVLAAVEGKEYLAGMFQNSVGEMLEPRAGGGGGWTDSVPVCGEQTRYVRPRSATNTRGEL